MRLQGLIRHVPEGGRGGHRSERRFSGVTRGEERRLENTVHVLSERDCLSWSSVLLFQHHPRSSEMTNFNI